jgi:hypothetical protein
MISYNQLIDLLQGIATAHEQINSFGEGNPWEIDATKSMTYPLMWAIPQPSATAKKVLQLKISLLFADLVHKDISNLKEVVSDQLSIATDVLAQLKSPAYDDNFVLDENAQLEPFNDKFDDEVAGWKVDLTFKLNYLSDRCAVPSTLLPVGMSSPCAPALVTDGDATVHSVVSGGSFACKTLPELLDISTANVIYNNLNTTLKLTSVIQVLSTNDLTINLTGAQVVAFIEALTSSEIYADLTAAQISAIIGLLTAAQLNASLSGTQINEIIQVLTASTIYADLTEQQQDDIIPLFPAIEIDENITTAQVTGLGSTNIQKLAGSQVQMLVLAQVQSLLNAQLLMLSGAQLIYVLDNAMSAQFINDNISAATRNKLNALYCLKTGQTTSYATFDDGYFQIGRTGFGALPLNNSFGNTSRFTDNLGGQVYAIPYIIDHATGYGWTPKQSAATWAAAVAQYGVFTLAGFNDFRLPNIDNMVSIINRELTSNFYLNYAPFSIPGSLNLWSSTTDKGNTANAWILQLGNNNTYIGVPTAKTGTANYYLVRTHF